MRRAQSSILLLGLALPLAAVALAALAVLGAQAQGLRAQRLAESAALRAALGWPAEEPGASWVRVERRGRAVVAEVRLPATALRLPLLGEVAYTAHGSALARATRTDDGRPGAVLAD